MAEWWSAQLVDRDGRIRGELPDIRGGGLEWNISSAVRTGGSIEFAEPPSAGIDWVTTRIRILHHDGAETRPMGVYRASWPNRKLRDGHATSVLKLEDPTSRLRSQLGYWTQYEAGIVVTDRVAMTLRQLGESQLALTSSSQTLRTPLTWDPDKTWGTLYSELLDAIGYGGIWCDSNGWWRAAPYVAPMERPLVATYGGDPADYRCRTTYEDEADWTDVPNRVLLYTRATSDTPALTSEVWITDPANPWHPDRVGPHTRCEAVEATSQEVLDAKARRLLAEGQERSRYVTWTHPVDDTTLGDRVRIRRLGLDVTIAARKITFGVGAVCETRGRHIYTGGQLWQ